MFQWLHREADFEGIGIGRAGVRRITFCPSLPKHKEVKHGEEETNSGGG
jgi:hypothetical protein